MKRFKLFMAMLAAVALLAATMGISGASADTTLHASQVGADSDTFTQECKGDEPISGTQVLWHFVLVQTTAINTGTLYATFENQGETITAYTKHVGGVVHWDVITDGSDVLQSATTDADGAILNLSHVCGGGGEEDVDTYLNVRKFYDANANGVFDGTDAWLTGWKVNINNGGFGFNEDAYTPVVDKLVSPDTYFVSEYYSTIGTWVHSASILDGVDQALANPVEVNLLAGDESTVDFGNYCTVGSGGKTLGFWSNKNGQKLFGSDDLAAMVALNLRDAAGTAFNPTTYAQFRTWLLSANATNMAYMLSAQLAAMQLNVLNGFVSGGAFVLGYGGTIDQLIAAADTSLGAYGSTPAGHAQRSYQESLKNYLDYLNNGGAVVPATPCAFSF